MDGHRTQHATAPAGIDRRRHPRVGVAWMAAIRTARGVFDCMVIDISQGGAKLAFAERPPLETGACATLDLEARGAVRSRAVWHRDNFVGICFTDPPDVIVRVLEGALPI